MSLNTYDYVRIAAGVIMMAVLAFQKPKHFILADSLLCLTAACVSFFAPRIWDSFVSVPFDGFHIFMQHAVACMMLLPVFFNLAFARHAKDDDAVHGLLGCRTVGIGLATLVFASSHWRHPGIFNEQQFTMMMIGHLMWFGLAVYHLYRSGLAPPKHGRANPINFYLKIDIVIFILAGLPDVFFPSFFPTFVSIKVDHLHEFEIVLFGVCNLSTVVLGIYALGFRNIAERKGFLWCRIAVFGLLAVCQAYSVYTGRLQLTPLAWVFICSLYPAAILAYIGLFLTSDHRLFSSSTATYNLRTRK